MTGSRDQRFWQRFAKSYTRFMSPAEPVYEALAQWLRPHLTEDMSVLELACGTGQLTFPLAGAVRRWEATDFAPAMAAAAKARQQENLPGLTFAVRDAASLPYPAACFDGVLIANALHIMPCPEKAMAEIRRVLKPGGLLLAPTFLWGGLPLASLRLGLLSLTGFRVRRRWTQASYLAWLTAQGFQVTDHTLVPGRPAPVCCAAARPNGLRR